MEESDEIEEMFKGPGLNGVLAARLYIILILLSILIFTYFHSFFVDNLLLPLAQKEQTSSWLLNVIVFLFSGFNLTILIRLILNRYRPSAKEYLPYVIAWIFYFSFRFSVSDKLTFDSPAGIPNGTFSYYDWIMVSTLPFLIVLFISIKDFFKPRNPFLGTENYFIEDIPLESNYVDEIGFDQLVNNLYVSIISDYYKKSFTVGIVSPWGSGKSSFIAALKRKINVTQGSNVITVEFHPYLNHSSEDVISEFFSILSHEMSKYSGKISSQITEYSDKLIRLYKNGEIDGILKKAKFRFDDKSMHELYTDIDDALRQISKPVVVYIDDLDRLSAQEILNVLKLIRNTANFANTVFVIAYDKSYVIKSLDNENVPDSGRYLDKFFQLEVFLPQIEVQKLKFKFLDLINMKKESDITPFVKIRVEEALNDPKCLFDRYVHNFRDVKRFYNQFIFEERILRSEIDLVDLLNFIFLKSKYPKFLQFLLNKQKEIFLFENYIVSLKPHEDYDSRITYLLKDEEQSIAKELNLEPIEVDLLLETLRSLFGEDVTDISAISIKRQPVFNRMLRLKYGSHDLSEIEFQDILRNSVSNEQITERLIELRDSHKLELLLDRMSYFITEDIIETFQIIRIYLILFDSYEDYRIGTNYILQPLSKIIHSKFIVDENANDYQDDFHQFIRENIFGNNLTLSSQLELLRQLWISKSENKLWNFSEEEIYKISQSLMKALLEEYSKEREIDYLFFRGYHALKGVVISDQKLSLKTELNKEVVTLLQTNETALFGFCRMILDPDSIGNLYRLSDVVDEIFESKKSFAQFVKNLEISFVGKPEFEKFLFLQSLTRFSHSIKFVFRNFSPRASEYIESQNPRRIEYLKEQESRILQIFFKVDVNIKVLENNTEFKKLINTSHSEFLEYEGSNYLYVANSNEDHRDFLYRILGVMMQIISASTKYVEGEVPAELINNTVYYNQKPVVELVSCQPDVSINTKN
ncbi:MAG: hypothetical protein H6599_01010 [Flavobacteriales bacterium]|nr:hypothetical protein [Flavobacteriales bacterium]